MRYAPQDVGLGVQTLFEGRTSAQMAGILNVPVGSWLPLESLSIIAEKAARRQDDCDLYLVRGHNRRQPVGPNIGEREFAVTAVAAMLEHHTGNHRPHAHPVRIPTAAGQPVRG